ncbi:MAG TPA: FAD-dependent oxidoreductase [Stellaceae bacterium]|nr:FAD-dependent oxidoreductase [Stellaceae bacterium]
MPLKLVIIGAGPAGFRAAEVLRQQSPDAEITLVGDEPHPPYQRPPLSKAYLTDGLAPPALLLQSETFYKEQRISLRLGVPATRIDRSTKHVELADGTRLAYDKLLIATGCRARRLSAFDHLPIHYLRGLDDAARLRPELKSGRSLVLIGGGFIGLEIAASAAKLGAAVTVLELAPRLMSRTMPPVVSDFARALHERHGVRLELGIKIEVIEATGSALVVRTEQGQHMCDLLAAGVGAIPNTELAGVAGLAVEDGIRVDARGRTSDPDIYAAGDVTRHDNTILGRAIRIESWQVALNQAAPVARAMLGAGEPYSELPWMWTDQYDCNIQVLGLPSPEAELIVRGDVAGGKFTALELGPGGRIVAAITVNTGRDMSALRRLTAAKTTFPREVLADAARPLAELAKAAQRGG